jgi:hypothetical protein
MKLRCSLLILSLAVSVVPAPAQTVDPRLTKPMVNTGLFNIRPDGSISGSAVDTAEESGAASGRHSRRSTSRPPARVKRGGRHSTSCLPPVWS